MSKGERVKIIRECLNMSQEKFGNLLGVTKVAISNIENGNRGLTDQMLFSICRAFNVNASWLRTGEGSIFLELPQGDVTASLVSSMLDPNKDAFYDIIIEIMKGYQSLSPKSKQAINELADNILKNLDKKREG